jgi:Ni2+-binding GTPase involved in maturation of urease and hydrogenase
LKKAANANVTNHLILFGIYENCQLTKPHKNEESKMKSERVTVVEKILGANDQLAVLNRARLDQFGVFSINLMASPGAGKTSLILQTIQKLSSKIRIGVVEGDTAPVTIDADKIIAACMVPTPVLYVSA